MHISADCASPNVSFSPLSNGANSTWMSVFLPTQGFNAARMHFAHLIYYSSRHPFADRRALDVPALSSFSRLRLPCRVLFGTYSPTHSSSAAAHRISSTTPVVYALRVEQAITGRASNQHACAISASPRMPTTFPPPMGSSPCAVAPLASSRPAPHSRWFEFGDSGIM
ncbi:hypothetical protein EVG20_g10184 [Dentipellis fragilis]|uniref:Uncharacterized protein n=1 Tax=Dentipellis fragilis TaxID=205917 RepID=A0A4Y9XTB7_9AGAM|nr:hypothetical protein EVG20_g10184 [Dentipellis fragilis]